MRKFPWVAVAFLTACFAQAEDQKPRSIQYFLKDSIARHADPERHAAFWDFLRAQGYTGVDLEVMDRLGNFYFYSPALEKLNWKQQPDALNHFLKSWNLKKDLPLSAKPRVCLDLSTLAQQMNETSDTFGAKLPKPSAREAGQVFLDLQDGYQFDQVCSEAFPFETQSILHWSAESLGKTFNLFAMTPSLDNLMEAYDKYKFDSFTFQKSDVFKSFDRVVAQDLRPYPLKTTDVWLPTMGVGDLAFSIARSFNREAWAAAGSGAGFPLGLEHNVLLYRAAQYGPAGYVVLPTGKNDYIYDPNQFDFNEGIKKNLVAMQGVSKWRGGAREPVANLVLSAQADAYTEPYYPQFIEPVMNALLSNGYDVRVSFGELMPKADLYYVANSDEWQQYSPFFKSLLDLVDEKKSRFFGPVILHPMGELKDGGHWRELRDLLKIPATEKGWVKDLPADVVENGRSIAWKGTVPAEQAGMTVIRSRAVRSIQGDVALERTFKNQTYALIVKSGSRYLVNGNFLHLEAAYFLSSVMGGALQAPVLAYVTSGRERTCVLALTDTDLKLKIPALDLPEEWTVSVWDKSGQRVQDTVIPGRDLLELTLNAWDLVVLKAKRKPVPSKATP